ncbi:EF-hand_domain pair [Hexamita inflata]|uniref:EF-hand domain pair n=1 Tax=Hexamita inflata TaxID=28002 RepID=A0AA86NZH2_9EUKA|nr:EF-hand domain pair [Hexamita inflata]
MIQQILFILLTLVLLQYLHFFYNLNQYLRRGPKKQNILSLIPTKEIQYLIFQFSEEIFLQLIYVLHYADLNNIIQVCFYMTDKGMQNELTYDQFKDFLTMIGVPIQDKHKKYISKLAINGMCKYAIVMDFISNLSCTQ